MCAAVFPVAAGTASSRAGCEPGAPAERITMNVAHSMTGLFIVATSTWKSITLSATVVSVLEEGLILS
jgi:hypothetical protein